MYALFLELHWKLWGWRVWGVRMCEGDWKCQVVPSCS